MSYITCPTCGYFLGRKYFKFEQERDKIQDNPEYSDTEKEELMQKLILGLNLRRYCCNLRMLTYKDLVHIITPVNNDNEK